jgi:hypothetical protein
VIKAPGPDANAEVVTNNTDFGHAMLFVTTFIRGQPIATFRVVELRIGCMDFVYMNGLCVPSPFLGAVGDLPAQ